MKRLERRARSEIPNAYRLWSNMKSKANITMKNCPNYETDFGKEIR
jgi:hypothetical protein